MEVILDVPLEKDFEAASQAAQRASHDHDSCHVGGIEVAHVTHGAIDDPQ
jgi:hypothetical protein